MSAVTIDGLEDWVLTSYRARAEATGRTVEEELRHALTREVHGEAILNGMRPEPTEAERAARRQAIERLDRVRERIAAEHGVLPDSTPGIREERESWG